MRPRSPGDCWYTISTDGSRNICHGSSETTKRFNWMRKVWPEDAKRTLSISNSVTLPEYESISGCRNAGTCRCTKDAQNNKVALLFIAPPVTSIKEIQGSRLTTEKKPGNTFGGRGCRMWRRQGAEQLQKSCKKACSEMIYLIIVIVGRPLCVYVSVNACSHECKCNYSMHLFTKMHESMNAHTVSSNNHADY